MKACKVHFAGNLAIRHKSKGEWTDKFTLVCTKGRKIAICNFRPRMTTTEDIHAVTCAHCRVMIRLAAETVQERPVRIAEAYFREKHDGSGYTGGYTDGCAEVLNEEKTS